MTIEGVKIFKNPIFMDKRGFFREVYKKCDVQSNELIFDCMSLSKKNVVRGLHMQTKKSQAKFLSVIKGKIYDVAVDLRKNSKTFGKYFSITLSLKKYSSIYIPEGFAHGFCGLERENIIFYSCSNYRNEKNEIGILWNDKDLNIKWPVKNPIISDKDKQNITFKDFCRRF